MFVAMIDQDAVLRRRLRPHAERAAHHRLKNPRGFFSPDSSVSSAWSMPMPPPPRRPSAHDEAVCAVGPAASCAGPAAAPCARAATRDCVGQVADAVARRHGSTGGRRLAAASARPPTQPPRLPSESASSKKTITPPYRDSELAELAEQALHLQDAHAHEHVDERARVDEHVGLARLAGDRLGHERLAGARRPPEQDAARHVAALSSIDSGSSRNRMFSWTRCENMVLAPDVGEPGLMSSGK